VTLERESLASSDKDVVHLWVANPTGGRLTKLRLHFDAPDFLHLGTLQAGDCVAVAGALPLGDLSPYSFHTDTACVRSDKLINEGDFKTLFVLRYAWSDSTAALGKRSGESFVVAERTLKLGLLGSETVAGVSLRLMTLVLPGLLFLMILRIAKSLPGDLSTAENAMFSVLISAALIAIGASLFPDQLARSSVARLGWLCLAAVVLALIGVLIQRRLAKHRADEEARPQVTTTDDVATALQRVFESAGMPSEPTVIRLRSGEEFVGAVSGTSRGGEKVLLGWFVVTAKNPAQRDRLEGLLSAGDFGTFFQELRASGLKVELEEPIHQIIGGQPQPTEDTLKLFAASDVAQMLKQPVPRAPQRPPLAVE
jgi:uncharacterized membrane protein YvlD (DUF360 family)